ncbi:MAG: DNA polymerase I, partial [Proteobacteria bacterium]|nr:DNA polymerase I [Pseudomonadota bacterium]
MVKKKTFILIDGSNCFYRAFHAIPEFSNSSGVPTNAVYGFTRTLKKLIKEYKPDYMAVAFDVRGKTVRHEKFDDYKATRKPMPDSLIPQVPYIKKMVKAFNIAAIEHEGFEADDVIATLAKNAAAKDVHVRIVSGDKDLFQLIDERTTILDYTKDKEYGPGDVEGKFGIGADGIRDMLSLSGDSSDNIPGVPGVGPKTAVKLLKEFGSFDEVFKNVDKVKGKKLKENLTEFKEQAELSRELVTLHMDLPLDFTDEIYSFGSPDVKALEEIFKELDFQKFFDELLEEQGGG